MQAGYHPSVFVTLLTSQGWQQDSETHAFVLWCVCYVCVLRVCVCVCGCVCVCVRAAGKAVVHTYTAGNEPYSVWEGLQRGSKEYEELKQQRAETLWKVRPPPPTAIRYCAACCAGTVLLLFQLRIQYGGRPVCQSASLESCKVCQLTCACAFAAAVHSGFGAFHS
jgi:hypothetical protein